MMYCKSCHCQRRAKCDSRDCYIGSFGHLGDLIVQRKLRYASHGVMISAMRFGVFRRDGSKRRVRIDTDGVWVLLT